MLHFVIPIMLTLGSIQGTASVGESKEQTVKSETYENKQKGYSIQYPSDWEKESLEGFDLFISAPVEKDGRSLANFSIISGEVPADVSQNLYYTLNLKNLLESNSIMEIQDNCKSELNGNEVFWLRYRRQDHTLLEVVQYLFVVNQVAFVITYGAPAEELERYEDSLDKIVQSFKIDRNHQGQ